MRKILFLVIAWFLLLPVFFANAQIVITSDEMPMTDEAPMTVVPAPGTATEIDKIKTSTESPISEVDNEKKTSSKAETSENEKLKPEEIYEYCKRSSEAPEYTNDLPSWRMGGILPDGEWSVGTAILSSVIKYDFAKKKAGVFDGAGVGASFRFYRDVKTLGERENPGKKDRGKPSDFVKGKVPKVLRLSQIHEKCRAASFRLATEKTIATPMISITPALFATKPVKDQEFRVEPAILLGFFQDLINVGAGFNLTGEDGDVGDVFLMFSIGAGFNWGGSD